MSVNFGKQIHYSFFENNTKCLGKYLNFLSRLLESYLWGKLNKNASVVNLWHTNSLWSFYNYKIKMEEKVIKLNKIIRAHQKVTSFVLLEFDDSVWSKPTWVFGPYW